LKKIITVLLLFFVFNGISQTLEDEKKSIEDQINKASLYYSNGEYNQALDFSKKALVRAFKINDDYLIAHSYNTIGVIYDEFSESKRAIEFYNKALQHADNTENEQLKNWIYGNLGSAYYYTNIDVNKAISFYKKSLDFAISKNDSIQIAYTKFNIASAYFSLNKFKEGIVYVNNVRDYVEKKGEEEAKFTLNSLLGIYHSNTNNPKVAEDYMLKSVAIANKNHLDSFLINAYENLAEHYKKNKQYKDKFDKLNKETYSDENKTALEKTAIQIELDESKVQLERIELENEKQLQKLKESKIITILFFVISLILLLLIFSLYRNITFRKKTNKELIQKNIELQRAIEKAEEASRLKTQFVSTITHELRTPLYGVVGITNIITDEHKELANSTYLNSLKFSAQYLLSLVNDILQINKMEENRLALISSPFVLQDEINTIINSVNYIASNHNNTLEVTLDKNIPPILVGDKLRLSQIIMNLVSNALKFTTNGTVKLSANLLKTEGSLHYIEFKVSDNGVGIAISDQAKIYDKFVQVERKDNDYQGTGLGLSIVKKLIELFGSSIQIESEVNKGTTFSFTIAFETKNNFIEEGLVNTNFDMTFEHPIRILVVEDNKINQLVTQKIMDKNNIPCDMASDGFMALHFLETNTYDVILMDISMPIINGYDTTKKIRSLGIQTPIIALTAYDKDEITDEAEFSGMNDCLIKPFEPEKLFKMIYQHIQKKEIEKINLN
jgi:signal transduction histidine kinase/ActR/RegA family two-component response regulator